MLFVRDVTGALGMLLKQLDEAVAKNKAVDLRSFAVFLTNDSKATETKLQELAQQAKLSEDVPLVIPEDPAALKPYKIHEDAAVTVVLYRKYKVLGNFAFRAGELRGYPKSFLGVFRDFMRQLGNGMRGAYRATACEASSGCC